jgi:hypothetical protein
MTSVGSTQDAGDANYMNGSRVLTGAQSVTVQSLSAYVGPVDAAPHNQFSLAVYTDNNGSPGSLVATSATGTLVANHWNTLPLSATLQPTTHYWLVYNTNASSASLNNLYYATASSPLGAFSNSTQSFGSWPSSFGSASTGSYQFSLYASVTAGTTSTTGPALSTQPLATGWNLLGLPTTQYPHASALAADLQTQNPGLVVRLISTYANGRYLPYLPGFSADLSLQQGQGTDILTSKAGSWLPQGSPPASAAPLRLQRGWNLLSVPYPTSMTAATMVSELSSAGLQPQEVAELSGGAWQVYLASGSGTTFTLTRTQAVMVLLGASGSWTPQ